MKSNDVFEKILYKARNDKRVVEKLLEIFKGDNPMADFCKYSTECGYKITPGDIITDGEEFSCNQLKSTNGGGVIPYNFFDDPFEMFITTIKMI